MSGQNENKLEQNKNINYINSLNINITTGYCAKCLKILDSNDKDIVKDVEGNEFCCRECRKYYYMEIRKEMDSMLEEWRNGGK